MASFCSICNGPSPDHICRACLTTPVNELAARVVPEEEPLAPEQRAYLAIFQAWLKDRENEFLRAIKEQLADYLVENSHVYKDR